MIMLVRIGAVVAIVFGALLWTGTEKYLGSHIGVGLLISLLVFALAVLALLKKAVVPGILGVLLAFSLPVLGFAQLPLTFHTLRAIQVAHVIFAIVAVGIAERLYSAAQHTH